MKKKLLIIGWEHHLCENMKNRELKELGENFDIVFARLNINALDEIAKASLQEKNPVRALVFHRNMLVSQPEKCKLIHDFALEYNQKYVLSINMINNDQDRDARDYATSAFFAKQNDWAQVAVLLDNNVK